MKSTERLLLLLSAALMLGCSAQNRAARNAEGQNPRQPVDYVNPYAGNISHLLMPTYAMTHLPNSMLRVHPKREDFTTDQIDGLPVILVSHRGKLAFSINPWQGEGAVPILPKYSYDNEKVTPYYYEVYLDDVGIGARFAPSHQSAVYELAFGGRGDASVTLDADNGMFAVEGNTISGYERLNQNTTVYLYAETDREPVGVRSVQYADERRPNAADEGNRLVQGRTAQGRKATIILNYGPDVRTLGIRYGVSFISEEQAKKNMYRETAGRSVDEVAAEGRRIWNETLSKIKVEGSENDKSIFYTSLYRTCERPINISEDGRYWSGFDRQVHEDHGRPFYNDDWLWDTYRATHPLRVLTEPRKEADMIHSLLLMAGQSEPAWMPTFPEVTGDSHRMNGNHGVAAVWDAYTKGVRDFDLEAAYDICKATLTEKSMLPWTRLPLTVLDEIYNEKGYFPGLNKEEKEWVKEAMGWERRQSVAVTLAMCYDDWCLSNMAEYMGKKEDAEYFRARSYNYRNVYNPETAFFHPRNHDGEFVMPFDYRYDSGPGARDYYDENNAWTYRWDLQHNAGDLIRLMGGRQRFVENLDQTFREPLGMHRSRFWSFMGDQTGNVGQFTMANEPSMHIPYLYNYAGQPWKTQKRVRTLVREWFRNDLMGVPGDEDGGGLTSFVVFSMMGFYPVTPGIPMYNVGSPMLDNVKIELGDGKVFEVEARNYSEANKYIQSATLNGKPLDKPWFWHSEIAGGGTLVLEMGEKANREWGAGPEDAPPSGYDYAGER